MLFRRKQEITHADTTVRARAKINLTLDVTGRREDGYHTVEMVMQSIALHDTVRVTTIHGEKKPRGIVLSCSLPFLPTDERNLAYRAAELFYKETGALLETCEIHIEKRIPVAAYRAADSAPRRCPAPAWCRRAGRTAHRHPVSVPSHTARRRSDRLYAMR